MQREELIKRSDFFVGYIAGIYAGLVVLFVDKILPTQAFLGWKETLLILLVLLFAFLMGLIAITIVNWSYNLKKSRD